MAVHGIANTDLVKSSKLQVMSAHYQESAVDTDVDNGRVVKLGSFVSGEREIRVATPVVTATADKVYLIRTPEVMYALDQTGLENFYNVASTEIRVYPLGVDDIFEITVNNIDATAVTAAVGKYLITVDGSNKLKVASDLTGNTNFAAIIEELTTLGYNKQNAVTVRVIKNA